MRTALEGMSLVAGSTERVSQSFFLKSLVALAASFLACGMALAQVDNTVGNFAGNSAGDWSGPGGVNSPVVGPPDGSCSNIGNVGSDNATFQYGFSVPGNATITNVNFYIKASAGNTPEDLEAQLAFDASTTPIALGNQIGTAQTIQIGAGNPNCASTFIQSFNFSLADWGTDSTEVTPAVVNDPNFGLNFITLNTSSIKVDSNCLEVEYTTPSGPATQIGCFTVQFTVNKDFTDNNPTPVEITLACTGEDDITANPLMASEGNPAVFSVLDIDGGATCTATETSGLPAGYAKDESDCQQGGLPADGGECTIVNTPSVPSMAVTKTVSNTGSGPGGLFQAGDPINYTIQVTNDGAIPLTNVVVSDPLIEGPPNNGTISCPGGNPIPSIAPAASVNCTGSYTVTQADIDNDGGSDGDIDNTATADSNETDPEQDSASAELVDQNSSLAVDKTVSNIGSAPFAAGDTVNYSIGVTNNGNTTLTNVLVSDPLIEGPPNNGTISCPGGNPIPTMNPGDLVTCTGSYTVTQADIDNNGGSDGDIDNTASADSDQTGPQTDSAEAQLVTQDPSIAVDKTVTNTGTGAGGNFQAGDTVDYSIEVTNDGNVSLDNILVSDPLIEGPPNNGTITCPSGNPIPMLAPGASETCTGSYTVTQEDIDNNGGGDGDIDNTATADDDDTGPQTASAEAQLVTQDPSIAVDKIVTNTGSAPDDSFNAGDTIEYSIEVTNDGNVTLDNILVSDPLIEGPPNNGAIVCPGGNPIPELAPGASETCTGSYTVTQADIDDLGGGDGDIDNTATADDDDTGPQTASAEAPLNVVPDMTVTKTVTNAGTGDGGAFQAGDTIDYTIEVTNDGTISLVDVVVSDPLIEGPPNNGTITCPSGNPIPMLEPAESESCTGSYTVTQADIDDNGGGDGDIDNTATAESDATGPESANAEAQLVTQDPSIAVDKNVTNTGTGDGGNFQAGDTVEYSIEVTNDGNTTLDGILVSDPLIEGPPNNGTISCPGGNPIPTLAPGASETCTGSYTVTQADIDDNGGGDGDIDNTATAETDETGPQTASAEAQLVTQDPSIAVAKAVTNTGTGPGGTFRAGDTVNYSIEVTNDGNFTLDGILVSDPLIEGPPNNGTISCPGGNPIPTLATGASETCTGSYTVTQEDIDNDGGGDGDIDNTATAETDETGPQTANAEAELVSRNPDIELVKTANPMTFEMEGEVITFSFEVSNTGNVTLMNIDVSDPLITDPPNSGTVTCPSGNPIPILAPGASETCTGEYTITAEDMISGEVMNLATASAECEIKGAGCADDDDSEVVESEGSGTTFRVQKDFSDDNPAGVTVLIECNTGLPLQQQGVVHDPDAAGLEPGNFTVIEFVVGDFEPGTMDCDIQELIPAGYEPTYTAGATTGVAEAISSDEAACYFEGISFGQFTCDIFNDLQPVDVVVEKQWIDENPEFFLPEVVEVNLTCSDPIVGGFQCFVLNGDNGGSCAQRFIDPANPGEFQVFPHFEGTTCTATEEPLTGVVTDESDCEELILFPGQGDSCVIVNTRLYAGIPTLSQYGLMLMALLMLGFGAVAYRRFV